MSQTSHRTPRHAFSLAETLIVLLILGVLAALVAPRFSAAAENRVHGSLAGDVQRLRSQIMFYRAQHNGVSPGYVSGDTTAPPRLDVFVAQLTQYTDAFGRTSPTPTSQHCFGPYLPAVPTNPVNGNNAVAFVPAGEAFPSAPQGPAGWLFHPVTGVVAANCEGKDHNGVAFFDY